MLWVNCLFTDSPILAQTQWPKSASRWWRSEAVIFAPSPMVHDHNLEAIWLLVQVPILLGCNPVLSSWRVQWPHPQILWATLVTLSTTPGIGKLHITMHTNSVKNSRTSPKAFRGTPPFRFEIGNPLNFLSSETFLHNTVASVLPRSYLQHSAHLQLQLSTKFLRILRSPCFQST
jgi:hypothetical protein